MNDSYYFRILKPLLIISGMAFAAPILTGCAALQTAIAKKDLDVQTKMSASIFLEPTRQNQKTVFVAIKNTSDQNFEVNRLIQHALNVKGYTVVTDPDSAHYWLRANILSIGKASPSAAEVALGVGYGGALGGLALGSGIGGAVGSWAGAAFGGLGGAVVGGVLETAANAAVKDVTYMVVTDVEIAEQSKHGKNIHQSNQQLLRQGIGGWQTQSSSESSDRNKYRTRMVSTANQVNLAYPEAEVELVRGFVKSIAGIF